MNVSILFLVECYWTSLQPFYPELRRHLHLPQYQWPRVPLKAHHNLVLCKTRWTRGLNIRSISQRQKHVRAERPGDRSGNIQ
jgi:hypothetical protein